MHGKFSIVDVNSLDYGGIDAHTLLGHCLNTPSPSWETTLSGNTLPFLKDHRLKGLMVLPGAMYVEAGLAIHKEIHNNEMAILEDLKFYKALVMEDDDEPVLRLSYNGKTREYTVYSKSREEKSEWMAHATGNLSLAQPSEAPQVDLEAIRDRCYEAVDGATHYRQMVERGLQYGPYFQSVRCLWRRSGEVLAQIESHAALAVEKARYRLHPTLLDACFQSLIATLDVTDDWEATALYVPVRIHHVCFRASPNRCLWSHGYLRNRTQGAVKGDLTLCDENGKVLVEVRGLRCLRIRLGKDGNDNRLSAAMVI